jgi:hypothetical protein
MPMSNQVMKELLVAPKSDGVIQPKRGDTLDLLTEEEKKAALRFCETCEDGQGYDVPKSMMKRLVELGLVVHKGRGWYEGSPALEQLQTESQG